MDIRLFSDEKQTLIYQQGSDEFVLFTKKPGTIKKITIDAVDVDAVRELLIIAKVYMEHGVAPDRDGKEFRPPRRVVDLDVI